MLVSGKGTTWKLPWLWYTKTFTKDQLSMKFVFIDTEILNKPSVIEKLPNSGTGKLEYIFSKIIKNI